VSKLHRFNGVNTNGVTDGNYSPSLRREAAKEMERNFLICGEARKPILSVFQNIPRLTIQGFANRLQG
jgi:hypothetical protein